MKSSGGFSENLDNFDTVLLNLFVGLCKGSPYLFPYSQVFSKKLGYTVFGIEQRLVARSRSLTPDMTLTSGKVACTLLLEWTRVVPEKKKDQLVKYKGIRRENLVAMGIPLQHTEKSSVIIIVPKNVFENYSQIRHEYNFVLLKFTAPEQAREIVIDSKEGNISERETDSFFSQDLRFQRVPMGYFPFSLENKKERLLSLTTKIARAILGFFRRGSESFSLNDLRRSVLQILSEDYWEAIGQEKKREVLNDITKVTNLLGEALRWNVFVKAKTWSREKRWEFTPQWNRRTAEETKKLKKVLEEARLMVQQALLKRVSLGDLFNDLEDTP